MSAVEDIRIKLENRLSEVEQEIESVRSALVALDNQEAAATAEPSSSGPSRKARGASGNQKRRRGKRQARAATPGAEHDADGSSSSELERLLAETGGLSAVELARQTGTDYGVVLARIRQLEQAGQNRR